MTYLGKKAAYLTQIILLIFLAGCSSSDIIIIGGSPTFYNLTTNNITDIAGTGSYQYLIDHNITITSAGEYAVTTTANLNGTNGRRYSFLPAINGNPQTQCSALVTGEGGEGTGAVSQCLLSFNKGDNISYMVMVT